MKLVIVESPTKAKTISKFLGKDYIVRSSFGHVRDLPKSKMGIDIERDFKPQYVVPAKAKKAIEELKDAMAKTDGVILASDEDREGEAIAWHLVSALGLDKTKDQRSKMKDEHKKTNPESRIPNPFVQRIVFHEITKPAIEHALAHPRDIDGNLVDAQQARRVLDRLVGYELSPFLWKKIRYGLSAGRVQSVAVRLVVEREREIEAFKAQEYWSINAELCGTKVDQRGKNFSAVLYKIGDKRLDKFAIPNETEAQNIVRALDGARYTVVEVTKKETRRNPAPSFITSTLQQEAARKLGMSAKQTMMLAQKLYETGLITYMRTDSVNLAQSALAQAYDVITKIYGREYALAQPRYYKNKSKGAQEAHEAIRPTDLSKTPDMMTQLETGQRKLYELIWKRTIATQMQQAVFDQTTVDVEALSVKPKVLSHVFRANGQVVKFDGFIRVYTEGRDDSAEEEVESQLPELAKGDDVDLKKLDAVQHFTEPLPRYTDATLVKALEAHGVGRPSTYAPTLTTIQERDYVEKEDKKYKPTEVGYLVTDMLVEHFPKIVDIDFTSHIEESFDDIAQGKLRWTAVMKEFYGPFRRNLDAKQDQVQKIEEKSNMRCEHCNEFMLIKFGRNGKFLACPDSESKITKPLPEEQAMIRKLEEKTKDEKCPECGKPMVPRKGRFGYFLGCSDYPKCKGIAKIVTRIGFTCPNCGKGDLIERKARGRGGKIFYGCSTFPSCNFLVNEKPENEEKLIDMLEAWKNKPKKNKRRAYIKR